MNRRDEVIESDVLHSKPRQTSSDILLSVIKFLASASLFASFLLWTLIALALIAMPYYLLGTVFAVCSLALLILANLWIGTRFTASPIK
jgi:hypothetical protein